jgi:EAL domain-containing protein (putative c-di-GMP-specific phosphodiesterase class I)
MNLPTPTVTPALARRIVRGRHYRFVAQEVRSLRGAPSRYELLWRPHHPVTGEPLSPFEVAEALDASTATVLAVEAAREGSGRMPVTVNLPADAFSVTAVLRIAAVNRDAVIEITETRALHRRWRLARTLARALRVRVALDDVGTGRCDIDRVALVRPDVVKLDRGLLGSPDARGYVAIARHVGAKVVCEGVEGPDGFPLAHRLGADAVQGWGVGRPFPFSSIDTGETWRNGCPR